MFKIKFTITYDGTHYFGWQRQPNKVTVQETVEATLSKIINQKISIHGAGRTDRGVHAKGQVAVATLYNQPNIEGLQKSLNALLPKDIRITEMEICDESFHPRYSAKSKTYCYTVITKKFQDPFIRHTTYHHPYPIDLALIKKAIPLFIGTKDFSSFANCVGKNSKQPSPIKTIYSIDVIEEPMGFTLRFHGNGFLYKMVRNITGALINFGEGRVSYEELSSIIESKDNKHKLTQAPAHGLCLDRVEY